MSKVIFIFGPTAVGKSSFLFNLPKDTAEIINVDSIQVYKEFNIASAKPSYELLFHVKHHLIDFLDPGEAFDLGKFYHNAINIIKEVQLRNKIPICVGGAVFYFKHLKEGLPPTPKVLSGIRQFVENLAYSKGNKYLLKELERIDPVILTRINKNDFYRIRRALEVYYQTGKPLSSFNLLGSELEKVISIGLLRNKGDLNYRIKQRINNMLNDGLLEEIKTLLNKGYDENTYAFRGIGYKEFLLWKSRPYYALNDILKLIYNNSCLYAKRQITFFNKISSVYWLHPEYEIKKILNLIYY